MQAKLCAYTLLICMSCGAFVESRQNRSLQEQKCKGPTSKHGAAQIRRAREGLQPRTGAVGRGRLLKVWQESLSSRYSSGPLLSTVFVFKGSCGSRKARSYLDN